jgi:hypothetical protein
MALTTTGFYGGDNWGVGMAKNVDAAPDSGSGMASHETPPATHGITSTALPQSTGAGKGSVNKGLVGKSGGRR